MVLSLRRRAINEILRNSFSMMYSHCTRNAASCVRCERIIEIVNVLNFSVNRIDASRYHIASV